MAVPTFGSVSPATGPVGGQNLVVITGTNFRLPDPQPATGPSEERLPTVQVKFDAEAAARVEVVSSTTLQVLVPAWRGEPAHVSAIPVVDITITNCDNDGVPIPGETVTATDAYTYARPGLRAPAEVKSFTQATLELLKLFRRQVVPAVSHTTHIDYVTEGELSIAVSTLPSLVVEGPTVTKDLERWHNEVTVREVSAGVFELVQPPWVAKLAYSVTGASDSAIELHNMMASVIECFERTKFLELDVDPSDPSVGRNAFVLQLTQPPQGVSTPSDSNVRAFTFQCEVRGLEISFEEAFAKELEVTDPEMEVQQFEADEVEVVPIE